MDIFAQATRLKLRFDTPQGQLDVEDLWDLPLSSSRSTNLDDIAIKIDNAIKTTPTTTFVRKATANTKAMALNQLAFQVVLEIIRIKREEQDVADIARTNKEKRQQLLSLLAQKETEELGAKSVDEIRALLNEIQ